MEGNKPWWQSKGVWGGLLALAASVAGVFGYAVGPEDLNELSTLAGSLAASGAAAIAILGRIRATKKIG